ncbi:MAG: hypothetical protein HFI34_04915 [Lachnospiraceae bacterium]|nr:hypothetical protein [Lachnospiraceae bacterium]
MAKKLGKVLLCTALIGSAVAGGMALYNKYKSSGDDFDDDSFDFDDDDDDFDDIADEEDTKDSDREYVSIPRESEDSAKTDERPVNVEVTIQSDDSSETNDDISASSDTAKTV